MPRVFVRKKERAGGIRGQPAAKRAFFIPRCRWDAELSARNKIAKLFDRYTAFSVKNLVVKADDVRKILR